MCLRRAEKLFFLGLSSPKIRYPLTPHPPVPSRPGHKHPLSTVHGCPLEAPLELLLVRDVHVGHDRGRHRGPDVRACAAGLLESLTED